MMYKAYRQSTTIFYLSKPLHLPASFADRRILYFLKLFLRKIPQLPAFLKSLVLRGYERGSHHPLSRLRKEVKP